MAQGNGQNGDAPGEAMSYVYIKSERAGHHGAEHDLFTVGFYEPSGKWQSESDHTGEGEAAKRVHWLNGGSIQSESAPTGTIAVPRTLLAAALSAIPLDNTGLRNTLSALFTKLSEATK